MPLSPPQDREMLHQRAIMLRGYERADGLFDIEGHLTDTKSYPFINDDRGEITPGEPLHDMWIRMTVDFDMKIVACEAATDSSPYTICPAAAPNFAALAGLTIKRGFLRAAGERVGGTHGCTHLREMLQQMATVAFQTISSRRVRQQRAPNAPPDHNHLVNTCYAYASDGPVVHRQWPELYTGPVGEPAV